MNLVYWLYPIQNYKYELPSFHSSVLSLESDDIEFLFLFDFFQESLITENTPDTFASEQTWPTEEELKDAEGILSISLYPSFDIIYLSAWYLLILTLKYFLSLR